MRFRFWGVALLGLAAACGGATSGTGTSGDGGVDAAGGSSSGGAGSSSGAGSSGSGGGSSSGAASGSSGGGSSGASGGSSGSGGGSNGASVEGGTACTTAGGCTATEICGFPTAQGCAAHGTCFPAPGATCLAYAAGCACDGTEINITCTGLPSGYVTQPLLHPGVCAQPDAGSGCTSDSQCSAGLKCCYPCGIPGCSNACVTPQANGGCPLYP